MQRRRGDLGKAGGGGLYTTWKALHHKRKFRKYPESTLSVGLRGPFPKG